MSITARALRPLPALGTGDDLARSVLAAWSGGPDDGDVLTVSSKAVAKVEGRTRTAAREEVVRAETDREVARRGELRIVRTRHGLVLAAAGVDASNTGAGTVVPLPVDPDGSARRLRAELSRHSGRNVAVVVTDTAGRAWRTGQTDIAVGVAGLDPLQDLAGLPDGWGRPLALTAPAVADELAGVADLVLGKADRTPCAVVSGLAALVLPAGTHGSGAAALVRPEDEDLFGLGTAAAVAAAVRRGTGDGRGFARPAAAADLAHLAEIVEIATDGHPEVTAMPVDGAEVPTIAIVPALTAGATETAMLMAAGAVAERLQVVGWAAGLRLVVGPGPEDSICAVTDDPASVH